MTFYQLYQANSKQFHLYRLRIFPTGLFFIILSIVHFVKNKYLGKGDKLS